MSAVIVKKEKIKSIVVTSDGAFKHMIVTNLNTAAFAGEKIFASTMEEIKAHAARDEAIGNMIIDGNGAAGQALLKDAKTLLSFVMARENVFTLIYVPEGSPFLAEKVKAKFPRTLITLVPVLREHFSKFFHERKGRPALTATSNELPRSGLSGLVAGVAGIAEAVAAVAPPKPAEKSMDETQRMFFEASGHVKETIEYINALSKDRANYEALSIIGQRFNGVMGTFAMFGDCHGFKELSGLASVIDDLCRTYEVEPDKRPSSIKESHANLLLSAAKLSFQILQRMREGKKAEETLLTEFSRIAVEHTTDTTISKRTSQEQVDIDALLDAELAS